MLTIAAKDFLETWASFKVARKMAGDNRGKIATATQRESLIAVLCKLNGHCNYLALASSAELSKKLLGWLMDQANYRVSNSDGGYTMPKEPPLPDFESVYKYMQDIGERLDHEIELIRLPIAPLDKTRFLDQDKLFGSRVFEVFGDSRGDVRNAGSCAALGLNNAAMFYLMCVVERGLRKMADDLGVAQVKPNLPIEGGTWNEVITVLQEVVNKGAPRSNAAAKSKLNLYSGLLVECRAIEHLWRNNVMHTRVNYNDEEVEAAFNHVERFMKKLAEL